MVEIVRVGIVDIVTEVPVAVRGEIVVRVEIVVDVGGAMVAVGVVVGAIRIHSCVAAYVNGARIPCRWIVGVHLLRCGAKSEEQNFSRGISRFEASLTDCQIRSRHDIGLNRTSSVLRASSSTTKQPLRPPPQR